MYLGSLHHYDLLTTTTLRLGSRRAFGALRSKIFSSRDIPERLKGKV